MTGRPATKRIILVPEDKLPRLLILLSQALDYKDLPKFVIVEAPQDNYCIAIFPEPGTACEVDLVIKQIKQELSEK